MEKGNIEINEINKILCDQINKQLNVLNVLFQVTHCHFPDELIFLKLSSGILKFKLFWKFLCNLDTISPHHAPLCHSLTRKDMIKPEGNPIYNFVCIHQCIHCPPFIHTRVLRLLMDVSAYQCPFIQPEFSGGLIGFLTGHPICSYLLSFVNIWLFLRKLASSCNTRLSMTSYGGHFKCCVLPIFKRTHVHGKLKPIVKIPCITYGYVAVVRAEFFKMVSVVAILDDLLKNNVLSYSSLLLIG